MEMKIWQDVIYLASCAVNNKIPDKEKTADMDLDAVYSYADRHMIGAMVAFALEGAGISDKHSNEAIAKSLRKSVLFDKEWGCIKEHFEKEGIWYMPLKGAVLKDMYPKYGMREFADYDILIDSTRAYDVKNIMEKLGYHTRFFNVSNHDVYYKAPMISFEMHTALFSPHRVEGNHPGKPAGLNERRYSIRTRRICRCRGWSPPVTRM